MEIYEKHGNEINQLSNEIIPYFLQVQKEHGNLGVVQQAYQITDEALKKSKIEDEAVCSKSCSFCCHDEIHLSDLEAEYIIWQMRHEENKNLRPHRGRLKKQNKASSYDKLKWMDKRCSMLTDEGDCSIYEIRPMICRTHFNVKDVQDCADKEFDPKKTIQEAKIMTGEAIIFALYRLANTTPDNVPSLHKKLYKEFIK